LILLQVLAAFAVRKITIQANYLEEKMVNKVTSSKAARTSSSVLTSPSTSKTSKAAAGSALSQVAPTKMTSAKAATAASAELRDGRTSAASKSAAGSALAQRAQSKRK
jgi:hypothetical protein